MVMEREVLCTNVLYTEHCDVQAYQHAGHCTKSNCAGLSILVHICSDMDRGRRAMHADPLKKRMG